MPWGLTDPAERAVATECEAFLDGRYAELVKASVIPVPVWAWMNLLAHGTIDELRTEARRLRDAEGWSQARAFLAGELVDLVDAGEVSLTDLQRDVLVPLELDVLGCRTTSQWTPAQLVSGLLAVLPDRRTRARR